MTPSDTGFAPGDNKNEFTNAVNARGWIRNLDLSVEKMEAFAQSIYGGHFNSLDDIRGGDQESKKEGKISLDGLVPALEDLERGCRYNLLKAQTALAVLPVDWRGQLDGDFTTTIAKIEKSIAVIVRLRKSTASIVKSISLTK